MMGQSQMKFLQRISARFYCVEVRRTTCLRAALPWPFLTFKDIYTYLLVLILLSAWTNNKMSQYLTRNASL